jgi:hypothetical protein
MGPVDVGVQDAAVLVIVGAAGESGREACDV